MPPTSWPASPTAGVEGAEGEKPQRLSVVLISEDAQLQKQLRERYPHLHTVSRKMFLDATWLEARDAFLKDSFLVVAELPRCRTASGTRNDRKIMDRFTTYLTSRKDLDFMIFAPRRSNAWQMAAIQSVANMRHVHI